MRVLVTGALGHLGEALMRVLPERGYRPVGLDLRPGTDWQGSVADPGVLAKAMEGCGAVLHTATLHKPQVGFQPDAAFVETNVLGTLRVLEAAQAAGADRVVFTSTTSSFGLALRPGPGEPARWIDEDVRPVPRNIYGVTKVAAEDICELWRDRLAIVILKASRFFPEADDDPDIAARFGRENQHANELTHRRIDLEDAAEAHIRALEAAPRIGFGRFILTATTPFTRADLPALRADPAAVFAARIPGSAAAYAAQGWAFPEGIGRVYDNARLRAALGWAPRVDLAAALAEVSAGRPLASPQARAVGAKGYPGGGPHYQSG